MASAAEPARISSSELLDIDPPAELFAVTGSLSDVEREASSTHREAHGKLRLLKTLIQQGRLPRRAVLIIRGDNKAAVNLLCGRRSEIWELTRVHREIFQILKDYELETYAERMRWARFLILAIFD